MAKKKASTPAKKAAPKVSPAKKGPVKKAAAPKKSAVKKSAPAKKAAKAPKASGGSDSVDGVIKKYEKERATQESQLTALTKKIDGLEKQSRSLDQQIEKLSEQRIVAQESIAQLDLRRDEEIAALLAKLGVSVGGTATISVTSYREVTMVEEDSEMEDSDSDMEDSDTEGSSIEEDSDEEEDDDEDSAEQKDDDLDSLLGGL
jgi:hypothetical protein